jgi:hypothetical protein
MRWIKHLTCSWEDEKLSCVTAEHGLEIYGFWWRILEIIGKQMDSSGRTFCEYPTKVWAKFAGVSPKKFQKLAGILTEKKLILSKNGGGLLRIDIPNLVKYRDEWTRKKDGQSRKTPE